jgi:hypothetical protein
MVSVTKLSYVKYVNYINSHSKCITVYRILFGDAVFKGWEPVPGIIHQGVYWMCRLPVTPKNIVVHNRNDRGHFLLHCATAPLICTTQIQLCKVAASKRN